MDSYAKDIMALFDPLSTSSAIKSSVLVKTDASETSWQGKSEGTQGSARENPHTLLRKTKQFTSREEPSTTSTLRYGEQEYNSSLLCTGKPVEFAIAR